MFSSAVLSADWVKMKGYTRSDGSYSENDFYDSETIKREGNFITAWTKTINFGLSRKDVYLMKRYFDCGNQRYQILYVKQTGETNEYHDFANNRQWLTIDIDDALNMNTVRRICGLYGLKP
jgi:hypothetical protein